MYWINLPIPPNAETNAVVVQRPRETDAIGLALTAAFGRPMLPADLAHALRTLDRIDWPPGPATGRG